jgi:WD40-like Beta Propeller Repeat
MNHRSRSETGSRSAAGTSTMSLALRTLLVGSIGISAAVGFGPLGCGSDQQISTFDPNAPGADGGGLNLDGSLLDLDGNSSVQYTDIKISPTDAVLTVQLGQTNPSIDYTVTGKRADGQVVPINGGTFEFERFDAAAFSQAKLLPTGFVGGSGQVRFKLGNNNTATTTATVKLVATSGTVPTTAVVTALDAASTADTAAKIIYPYDGTVFPRGFAAPILQWQGPANTPVYRVKAVSPTFELTAYVASSPANGRFDFPTTPANLWSRLADSTSGKIVISIQRYDGTKAFTPVGETLIIAPGSLKSSVYYTRLTNDDGQAFVRKLEPGQPAQDYLQKNGERCIACHSISRDGKRTVASINGDRSPWGVWDNKTGALLYQSQESSGFQAISPDGEFVVWGQSRSDVIWLSRYNNDAKLATLALPDGSPVVPVFSPDGKKLAFGSRTKQDWLDYSAATVYSADVDLGPVPAFSNYKRVVDATAAFPVATSPTFSPDSKWLGFMRANRSKGSLPDSRGELWVTDVDGKMQVRLGRANGEGVLADTTSNWGPSFHPVAAGGYYWVAFYAKRAHGHINTSDTVRQLWIAAVSTNIQPGQDPSFPAFYITGQDETTINERPQFAIPVCKELGNSCEAGYECCDGFCRADAAGKFTCQKPNPNECARSGEVCKANADCCGGSCIGGTCQSVIAN